MKNQLSKIWSISLIIILGLSVNLFSKQEIKPNGIGFRGGPYMMNNQGTEISVHSNDGINEVNIGGFGGWIYIFSRLQNKLYLDLTLGGAARVEEQSNRYHEDIIDVYTVSPLLIGVHYDILSEKNESSLRPYISTGAGPYWISHVKVNDRYYEDEVNIGTNMYGGAYLGSGINFPVKSWLGINFDMKYHFVNFNADNKFSGFEYGIGLHFMWGKPVSDY